MPNTPSAKTWTCLSRVCATVGQPSQITTSPSSLLHPPPITTFQFGGNGNILVLTHAQTSPHSCCAMAHGSGPAWVLWVLSSVRTLPARFGADPCRAERCVFPGNDQRWTWSAGVVAKSPKRKRIEWGWRPLTRPSQSPQHGIAAWPEHSTVPLHSLFSKSLLSALFPSVTSLCVRVAQSVKGYCAWHMHIHTGILSVWKAAAWNKGSSGRVWVGLLSCAGGIPSQECARECFPFWSWEFPRLDWLLEHICNIIITTLICTVVMLDCLSNLYLWHGYNYTTTANTNI